MMIQVLVPEVEEAALKALAIKATLEEIASNGLCKNYKQANMPAFFVKKSGITNPSLTLNFNGMENVQGLRILTIDIGGSHVKATILNEAGQMIKDYEKKTTPVPATPENIINTIKELVKNFPEYDKISVGFPGFVKNGTVMTAPNLGSELWQNIPFQNMISDVLGKPAQVINDADLQGLGVVKGNGLEIVVTLGTGFGTAVLFNGKLLPHLELAHHPITKHKDYDQYIGEKALINIGDDKWNQRMQKVLGILKTVFNYDHLYISGGNSSKLRLKAESNITIVTNKDGIKGGAKLWI